jgi:hypothetical protein
MFASLALLSACASFSPLPTDKIQTAEQAIQIAKAMCDVRGLKGGWGATWNQGIWTVEFFGNSGLSMLQVPVASGNGKASGCNWVEI